MGVRLVLWGDDVLSSQSFFHKFSENPKYLKQGLNLILEELVQKNLFPNEEIEIWKKYNDVGSIKNTDEVIKTLSVRLCQLKNGKVITREQKLEAFYSLLKGLTLENVIRISSSIDYNPGAREAIKMLGEEVIQTLYTDDPWPCVDYQIRELGIISGKGAVPVLELPEGRRKEYNPSLLFRCDAKLTGEVKPLNKSQEFAKYLKRLGIDLKEVAAIDSPENMETLSRVQEAGGVAIGYPNKDEDIEKFSRNSIPVLKDRDLRGFAEIVLDPRESVIGRYCE